MPEFTDYYREKLDGMESNATTDLTADEIVDMLHDLPRGHRYKMWADEIVTELAHIHNEKTWVYLGHIVKTALAKMEAHSSVRSASAYKNGMMEGKEDSYTRRIGDGKNKDE